jgi:hypothetical protein
MSTAQKISFVIFAVFIGAMVVSLAGKVFGFNGLTRFIIDLFLGTCIGVFVMFDKDEHL